MIITRLCIALPQNINRDVSVVVIIIGYPISTRAAHAVTFRSVAAAAQSKFSFIFIFFLPQKKNTVKLFGLLVYHTVAVVVVSISGEGGGVFVFCITLIR